MIIRSVEINNFLILREAKVDLHNRGLTRICGENLDDPTSSSNGSGKSTIIEAVYWALFGDTLRHIRSADGVINNNVGKNCSVVLNIDDGEDSYRIERYRKHSSKKNNLYIYINGVDSRGKDNRETQAFIESVIGMDKQSFSNSVIFGQGHSKNLRRFSEMSDSEKKETIEKVLELDVLSLAHSVAKTQHKSLVSEMDMVVSERDRILLELSDIDSEIECSKLEMNSFHEVQKSDLDSANLKKKEVEDNSTELKSHLDSFIDVDVSGLTKKIDQCTEIKDEQNRRLDSCKEYWLSTKADIKARYKSIERDISALNSKASKLMSGEVDGELCDRCGGVASSYKISMLEGQYQFEINDKKSTLDALRSQEVIERDKYKNILDESTLVINKASELISDYEGQIAKYQLDKQNLDRIKDKLEFNDRLIKDIDSKIVDIGARRNPWESVHKKWCDKKESVTESVEEKNIKIEALSKSIEEYSFWVKGYSKQGIRSYLLDKVIPFLNERVNHYLDILTDGTITANFSAVKAISSGELRENFNLEVRNLNAADVYEGNSGGERRRIDLAVSLAFNDFVSSRNNRRINILLLDEVFEGVDETGLYYVIKVLEDLSRRKSSVFVITHRNELASYFSNAITVSRKNGMSEVIDSVV